MGAVGFTSTTADRDFFKSQRAVEDAAVRDDPDLERRELAEFYRSKGFSDQLLGEVVATITANRDKWVETILEEERHLQPVSNQDILRSSVTITLATLIGHLIPLLPFVFLGRSKALVLAVILSGIVLFGVGTYQALTRVGSWWKQGVRMVLIGLGAAALGFAIGHIFHASGA
jgi:VIT1/CCC1 family predicted Fe2+/Mn2+ transporter